MCVSLGHYKAIVAGILTWQAKKLIEEASPGDEECRDQNPGLLLLLLRQENKGRREGNGVGVWTAEYVSSEGNSQGLICLLRAIQEYPATLMLCSRIPHVAIQIVLTFVQWKEPCWSRCSAAAERNKWCSRRSLVQMSPWSQIHIGKLPSWLLCNIGIIIPGWAFARITIK